MSQGIATGSIWPGRNKAPLANLMQVLPPVSKRQDGAAKAPSADGQDSTTTVFTVPNGQQLAFAYEIPPTPGIAETKSYIFITENVSGEGLPTRQG
jgi:hypothetical protein